MHKTERETYDDFRTYLSTIEQISSPIPSTERHKELELGMKMRNGNLEARDKLIYANLRLAVRMALVHKEAAMKRGTHILDVITYAVIGLWRAVEKYKPEMGRVSTYAKKYIRGEIYRNALRYCGSGVKIPSWVKSSKVKVDSLDEQIFDDEGNETTLKDILKDDIGKMPDKKVCSQELSLLVDEALSKLDPIDSEILKMRFGFYGKSKKRSTIGKEFCLTREAIRIREKKALAKLKTRLLELGGKYNYELPWVLMDLN